MLRQASLAAAGPTLPALKTTSAPCPFVDLHALGYQAIRERDDLPGIEAELLLEEHDLFGCLNNNAGDGAVGKSHVDSSRNPCARVVDDKNTFLLTDTG
ncbi:hypothetical protein DL769_010502 [Monosporascus sp. CRB-8-3]|nr:hypothetical protein DL769_010502 [Monosporascus sp. CRB-8-3]